VQRNRRNRHLITLEVSEGVFLVTLGNLLWCVLLLLRSRFMTTPRYAFPNSPRTASDRLKTHPSPSASYPSRVAVWTSLPGQPGRTDHKAQLPRRPLEPFRRHKVSAVATIHVLIVGLAAMVALVFLDPHAANALSISSTVRFQAGETPTIVTTTQSPNSGPTSSVAPIKPAKIVCASPAVILAQPMSWRMANLVVVSVKNTYLAQAQNVVKTYGIGGVLVRGAPRVSDGPALRKLRDLRVEMPTFVAVDEEGGRVQHLKKAIGPLPSALNMAKTKTAEQVRAMARKHAVAMRALGFTVDFGPVLDLYNGTGNGIGDRAFSDSPDVVAAYGQAFAQGLIDGGILPVLKHWPGGGSSDGDPHNKGTTTKKYDDLKVADLLPFNSVTASLSGVGIMVGHQQVPGLSELPSSVSERAITQLLRAENRFNGLVISDSLSMWSIQYHWPAPKAAEMALRAGNDVLLFDDEPGIAQIVSALTDAANADKVLAARAVDANLRIMVAKGIPLCEGTTVALPAPPKKPSA
jgi:beta-N-acetylhexosaminidase